MTYVIAEPCVDVRDRACVEECPLEAIDYEPPGSPGGAAKLGVAGADTAFVAGLSPRR